MKDLADGGWIPCSICGKFIQLGTKCTCPRFTAHPKKD